MKCILAFFLGAAAMFAADFTTGQAARLVIGQQDFTAANPNSSNTVIGGAGGVAYAADTLFIADDNRIGASPNNNRVLIFPNVSGQFPSPTAVIPTNSICPICVGSASVVLGQADFTTSTTNIGATQNNLREPTAIASDGIHLVVADTNHNRVLIWNHIPSTNNAPADVVVGQPNFTSSTVPTNGIPSATSLNGPQGVWIQNGKLFIADTQNNRVLIYNKIPTTNGVAADVVVGAPNFTTFVQTDITQQNTATSASNMLDPVSVTSDGVHLFVTDLGYNRVLIWDHIPTTNGAAADHVVGQPDMTGNAPNNAYTTDSSSVQHPVLCANSNGTDSNGNPTYPGVCNATLNYPRFALSDGHRLFIADGGNDRVLEFLNIPTTNGASADVILGQIGGEVDQATDAADSMNTPTSMAFDGSNLYVADPYNRRITVYTIAPTILPYQAVVNAASLIVNAKGTVTIGGTINNGDIVTITINSKQYTYTVKASDAINDVIAALVAAINADAGDPNVLATADDTDSQVVLTARLPGAQGNNVTLSATVSTNAKITASASGSTLSGGGNAASVAPGTLVTITGTNLAAQTASADLSQSQLPTTLGGAQVYFDGIQAPLTYVSPTQINAQIPWEFTNTTSVNAYVRADMGGGNISYTSPVAVTIVSGNPGIFGQFGTQNPELGIAYHYSSHATAILSVDGSITAGDNASVTVHGRTYSYTVQSTDTLDTVRDAFVQELNQDPEVTAAPSGPFDRIILSAKVAGPDGDGIPVSAACNGCSSLTMSAFDSATCCANIGGSLITPDNPAQPGELIILYATGLGLPVLNGSDSGLINTGQQYPVNGPVTVPPSNNFANAIAGGSTADVIQATLMPGTVGIFEVVLHLSSGLTANANTSVTIAQGNFVSNAVAIPVGTQASTGAGANSSSTSTPVSGNAGGNSSSVSTGGSAAAPATSSNAAVSAAYPRGGAVLGQGGISSLFGTNLAAQTASPDTTGSLPFTLGGASMTIGGVQVPLFYASPTQVNFQAPFLNVTSPTQVPLVITQGSQSATVTVTVSPYVPAIFTTNSQGTGQASALIDGTSTIVAPVGAFPNSRPAERGEYVSLYATGLGDVANPPGIGNPAPASPDPTLVTPTVALGGQTLDPSLVTYSGLAPGFVGLYQINFKVPDNAPSGDAVPVSLAIAGQTSNTATIAIQ
jgi:uncharacterized protein (TIGR03437 family)